MKKIFIVEDEMQLIKNISLLLWSEGYEVFTAGNGLDALNKLEHFTPDLIISDIMMPYLSGYELLQRIRQNKRIKFTPFLFLTAKSDVASFREGMNLGADDYITKPFSSDDLLRTIKIRLEKSDIINEHIDEIRDSISKFVPHELRTPLVAILGYSQIILSENESLDKNEIVEMTERINIGAKRLHNRIEKFIQLSDIEPVTKNIWNGNDKICEFNEDFIKQITLCHYFIKDRKDKIEISVEPAELKIPNRIFKIVIKELLENAVKFSEPDKSIIIKGNKEQDYYCLEINDSGIGMEDYQINNIGAFQQFDRDIYQQEGNGLGLIFVKKALKMVDGELVIESRKNEYTIVKLKIPLAPKSLE